MSKKTLMESAVLWICRTCEAINLHPVRWEEFECVNCGTIYYAPAENQDETKEKNK